MTVEFVARSDRNLGMALIAALLLPTALLVPSAPTQPPPSIGRSSSRREALKHGLLALATTAVAAQPAHALFESKEQVALQGLSTAQPKLKSLVAEVSEVKRKRAKMAVDAEDDAYVFRFARAVLDPASKELAIAAPKVNADGAQAVIDDFNGYLKALDAGCRAQDAATELEALVGADKVLSDFLDLAKSKKYDTNGKDDINGYEGATGILYNKFLFRSG